MKSLNNLLLISFDILLLHGLVSLNLVKSSYLRKFNKLLKRMSSKEENNFYLLKGNALFNNELIQFKSLELNEPADRRGEHLKTMNEFNSSNYNYSASDELFEKFDHVNSRSVESSSNERQANAFTQDMLLKNFNSILHQHQNQLIAAEDISSSLQINEKDSSFDEETVDYRVEHIRKLASGLFMMNGSDGLIKSKATLKKEIDYGLFDLKKYSGELIDLSKCENNSSSSDDEMKSDLKSDVKCELKSDLKYKTAASSNSSNDTKMINSELMKSEMMKSDLKSNDKYDSKNQKSINSSSSNYILDDDLRAFEESLLERYKKLAKSSNEKTAKLYDSTGELNGHSSPSSLNSMKSSDLSTTLADYNYLTNSNESTGNQMFQSNDNTIDYLKLGAKNLIDNSKQVNEIEQKLNESRSENLNLMIALENNNSTMKKNLEMAKSLKDELESTKANFSQFKQQSNLVMENLMNKNKLSNQELTKCKQALARLEEERRKELEDQKIKNTIELNELKGKLNDKEEQLKLTTADLYQANKKIKDHVQRLSASEQKLEECDKKLNVYVKELNGQKAKLELSKEEIDIRKRRILTLEENLGVKLTELDGVQEELANLRKENKQLDEKNGKLLQAIKQVDAYADKYKLEYEKRLSKEKDLSDLKQAIKRVIAERDETFKQLEVLKANWKQYQQQAAEQQLQLQQQLTTTPSLESKYHYPTGRLSKIYSSPSLTDYYDTSNSIVPTTRSSNKHRLNEQNELRALEKIEDDKSSLINVISKQNYLNNLLSLSEQLNCDQCMLSNSYSQFNTLQMNGSNAKQHLADHCADLMNHIRQQKELQQNELAFINSKNGKKLKKESQKITKLEKK